MRISDWSSYVCSSDLLRGAVEEDHRQLAVLEDEVNKTVVVIDRLLNELTDDIARTQNYFANERLNLTPLPVAIDTDEYIGGTLSTPAHAPPAPAHPAGAPPAVRPAPIGPARCRGSRGDTCEDT